MLSSVNTHFFLYLTISTFLLLCIVNLAEAAPVLIIRSIFHHRHLQPMDLPFPYGKLADKILNVNTDISYVKHEIDEGEVGRVI